MHDTDEPERQALEQERTDFLGQLEEAFETPMIVLAFIWLILLVVEFLWGLSPLLQTATTAIWILFALDFLLRFAVAPRKSRYLRRNWLTALSLALPALRLFRLLRPLGVLRAARATRGLRLVRVVGSMNRGMRALRATMQRRGAGYVVALTLVVLFVGAAGMYGLEQSQPAGTGFDNYGEALWWTAMLLTTVGSEYWPQTAEGRLLCLLLAIYSLGILGYITAALASLFVGRDVEEASGAPEAALDVEALRAENAALRAAVHRLSGEP